MNKRSSYTRIYLSIVLLIIAGACGNDHNSPRSTGGVNAISSVAGSGGQSGGTVSTASGGVGGSTLSVKTDAGTTPTAGNIAGKGGKGGLGASGKGGAVAGASGKGSAGKGSSPTGAPGCGKNGGKLRGKTNQSVTAAGVERTFVLYEPKTIDAKKPVPLVIVPHGFTMSGEQMYKITGYDKIADREGIVVAYPDGQGTSPWYVGENTCAPGSTVAASNDVDQAFLAEIIKLVDADQCVDRAHMFVTGFSMGGYFSYETGCMNSDIRAVGPHSGGNHDMSSCKVKRKPIIMFHFESDSLIPYTCGTEARDRWIERNGCSADNPETVSVKGGTCEYYKKCPADGQVAFCHFQEPDGGAGELLTGHGWSGGAADSFAIPPTESATDLGWAFFKKYAW